MDEGAEREFREYVACGRRPVPRRPAAHRAPRGRRGPAAERADQPGPALASVSKFGRSMRTCASPCTTSRSACGVGAGVGREYVTADPPDVAVAGDEARDTAVRLALDAVLRQLTRRQRAVIVLRYYEDLPEAEVAEILGCSVGTVRSQTHRTPGPHPGALPRARHDQGIGMMTPTETALRDRLHELADQPAPPSLADRALAGARRARRRQAGLVAAARRSSSLHWSP